MSELRGMLEETVGRLFGELVTKELIEAAERGDWPGALWEAVETNGLTRPHLSEDLGGAGGTWREAFVILRAAGRYTRTCGTTSSCGGQSRRANGLAANRERNAGSSPLSSMTNGSSPFARAKAIASSSDAGSSTSHTSVGRDA